MSKVFTSNQTHYRSYRGRVLRIKRPNQQCGGGLILGISGSKCPAGSLLKGILQGRGNFSHGNVQSIVQGARLDLHAGL